jgi:hypothetical protein
MEFVPWVSVEALCCGYWEFHSRLSSCSHFSCITDELVAFGGLSKGGPLLFSSTLPNTPRLVELLDDILDLHPQAEAKLKGSMTTYLASLPRK